MVGDYLRMHGFRVTLVRRRRHAARGASTRSSPTSSCSTSTCRRRTGSRSSATSSSSRGVPVIMLTATASAIDRVVGLELGADDYIAKPCELRELVARIRSVLRRTQGQPPRRRAPTPSARRTRSCASAPSGSTSTPRVLRDDDGVEHPLTASEFGLLKAFAENPKRVLTRERLLDLANARDPDAFDRAIDVRITRIRKQDRAGPRRTRASSARCAAPATCSRRTARALEGFALDLCSLERRIDARLPSRGRSHETSPRHRRPAGSKRLSSGPPIADGRANFSAFFGRVPEMPRRTAALGRVAFALPAGCPPYPDRFRISIIGGIFYVYTNFRISGLANADGRSLPRKPKPASAR